MPGPCSAPNGNASTSKARDQFDNVSTGKTALKHGRIEHQTKVDTERRLQKEWNRQRHLNEADLT